MEASYRTKFVHQFWSDTKQWLGQRLFVPFCIVAVGLAIRWFIGGRIEATNWILYGLVPLVAFFIVVSLINFFRTSYLLYRNLEEEANTQIGELKRTIDLQTESIRDLQSRLEPKFEIVYEKKDPFQVIKPIGTQHQRRTYLIGIHNISGYDLRDVKVELKSISPPYANDRGIPLEDIPLTYLGLPIELRQINDQAPYRKEFSLSPDRTQMIEVVSKMEANESSPSTLTTEWLSRGMESIDLHIARQQTEFKIGENPVVQNYIYAGKYELTIFVTASNAPAGSETFIINIDDRGWLSFERKP